MVNKLLRLLSIFGAVSAASVLIIMNSASAEDDNVCSGQITGQSLLGNVNAGITYFDSHSTSYAGLDNIDGWDAVGGYYVNFDDTGEVPLDILLGEGIGGNAPVFREHAACVSKNVEAGAVKDRTYSMEGYAWNGALGFISYYCNASGVNPEPITGSSSIMNVPAVACGNYEYGVEVGTADVDGERALSGYAWSPSFGYLQFQGETAESFQRLGGYHFEDPSTATVQIGDSGMTGSVTTVDSFEVNVNGVLYKVTLVEEASVDSAKFEVENLDTHVVITNRVNEGVSKSFEDLIIKLEETRVDIGESEVSFLKLADGSGGESYEVVREANGLLKGYAWSEAGIWVPMNGVMMELPGEDVVACDPSEEDCSPCQLFPEQEICVDVVETMGTVGVNGYDDMKIADGDDGYEINLYMGPGAIDGDAIPFLDQYAVKLNFEWEDTVKANQFANVDDNPDFGEIQDPWNGPLVDGERGAILFKPIEWGIYTINQSPKYINGLITHVEEDHYKLPYLIRSYAPTTAGNISFSEADSGEMAFKNENFIKSIEGDAGVWTDDVRENRLILKGVSAEIYDALDPSFPLILTIENVLSPTQSGGIDFDFKPAIELNTLYARDNKDSIHALHSLPIDFHGKVIKNTSVSFTNEEVKAVLDYNPGDCAGGFDTTAGEFDFEFIDGVEGDPMTKLLGLGSALQDFNGIASFPDLVAPADPDEPIPELVLPCNGILPGPSLYSEISYSKGGKAVSYYGNKLPRNVSYIENPSITVKGNIYAPEAFSSTADNRVQATSNVSIVSVRDAVKENVVELLGNKTVSSGETCNIVSLSDGGSHSVNCVGGTAGDEFEMEEITETGEHVLYFGESDVHLKLGDLDIDGNISGKWAIVIDGGRLFIDEDVWSNTPNVDKLAVAVLKEPGGKCVDSASYIANTVGNIQMNLASDCSLFSYDPSEFDGLPFLKTKSDVVTHYGAGIENPERYIGLPNPGDIEEFENSRKRLLFQGSIASKNTIGGSYLDLNGKNYISKGDSSVFVLPVTDAQRKIAQAYDLNYLRSIPLKFEYDDYGRIVDQACGVGLDIDQIIHLENGGELTGVLENCNGVGEGAYDPLCDEDCGDMVLDLDGGDAVKGLGPDDTDPVYVYYVKPDSFLFEKEGGVTSR